MPLPVSDCTLRCASGGDFPGKNSNQIHNSRAGMSEENRQEEKLTETNFRQDSRFLGEQSSQRNRAVCPATSSTRAGGLVSMVVLEPT